MWTYAQLTGRLRDLNLLLVGVGYSGKGPGKNNPAMQEVQFVGPIPCGFYTIGAPFESEKHGPYCLPLTPDKDNTMFGRSAFLIHGDAKFHLGEASEGCIIQARDVRERVWNSGDHRLQVVSGIIPVNTNIST